MEKIRIATTALVFAALSWTSVNGQTRKEVIENLNRKTDSLEKALLSKNENVHKLEVELAKLKGINETLDLTIKRSEAKADSLVAALNSKNIVIEKLNGKLSALNQEIDSLQTEGKNLADEREALQAELTSFKEESENAVAKESQKVENAAGGSLKPAEKKAIKSSPALRLDTREE